MLTFPDPDVLLYSGIFDTIAAAGYAVVQANGIWLVTSGPGDPAEWEAAVQQIINGYNVLPDIRNACTMQIKVEGLRRINLIFYAIDSLDELDYQSELWASIKATAKQTTSRMQAAIDTYAAAKGAINQINAAETKTAINAVVVVWP